MNNAVWNKHRSFPGLLSVFFALTGLYTNAQTTLPLMQLDGQGDKPFVLMISGDGGTKGFTVSLAKAMQAKGYSIAVVDARKYFWEKKTPEETASAIAGYMARILSADKSRHWVMAGYSFGADVTPFVINRLPDSLKTRLTQAILISPSTSTDFEIHVSDMLGIAKKRDMDVIREINRMGSMGVFMLGGDDEADFPLTTVRLPHFSYQLIKGNHHFDGDYNRVAETISAVIAGH